MFTLIAQTVVALASILLPSYSYAQAFPDRTVTLVVATTPGGQTDVFMRQVAEELRKQWGQPVIIENKPGASTIIAATYVARARPDGYTILVAQDATLSSNQYLHKKLSYDPVKDFTPVLNMIETTSILVARPSFAARTVPDLISLALQKPGAINYGSFGFGSKTHLDIEAFSAQTGIKLAHIPYRGIAEVLTALLGGQIDIAFSGIAASLGSIHDEKLNVLGIAGSTRSSVLPDVPTFAEQGVPNFESRAWFGLVVPTGTSQTVIDKIARDTSKIITNPEFLQKNILGAGLGLLNQLPNEFAAFLEKDRSDYEVRVQNANVERN